MSRFVALTLLTLGVAAPGAQVPDTAARLLQQQYELSSDGRAFLLEEAANAGFFMLGELHGENEIPALIRAIWPSMWEAGYRRVAAEISPWAAHQLEFGAGKVSYVGLWTRAEAAFVTSLKKDRSAVLWGCDIEEVQAHLLIRDLAALNPLQASLRREAVMKDLFLQQWRAAGGRPKVFLRFGRNHLHRGYDRRGVSTLGKLVAELAAAERMKAFNVAAFSGGGAIALVGPPAEFDERGDDPAFAYLASIARYPATVFDLRPLRQPLHRIPGARRSPLEASLVYWADSYDAMIYYREVTPLQR